MLHFFIKLIVLLYTHAAVLFKILHNSYINIHSFSKHLYNIILDLVLKILVRVLISRRLFRSPNNQHGFLRVRSAADRYALTMFPWSHVFCVLLSIKSYLWSPVFSIEAWMHSWTEPVEFLDHAMQVCSKTPKYNCELTLVFPQTHH